MIMNHYHDLFFYIIVIISQEIIRETHLTKAYDSLGFLSKTKIDLDF